MTPSLQLDLNTIPIDPDLVRQVPYALSRYYLALPLGRESDCVSIAMAYPENEQARRVLGRLLQARVVPVFAPAETLRPALDRLHAREEQTAKQVVVWHGEEEWEAAVTAAAALLAEATQSRVTRLAAPGATLQGALSQTASGAIAVAVCPLPPAPLLAETLSRAAVPLYFVRGEHRVLRRILVVLRGFASDERALDWLAPFAQQHGAAVTLMPLNTTPGLHLREYHESATLPGQHLRRCVQHLRAAGAPVDLKFRQGDAVQQVVDEVSGDAYDLLVLAAEGDGGFVTQVILSVEQQKAHRGRPVFVLRPPRAQANPALSSRPGEQRQ